VLANNNDSSLTCIFHGWKFHVSGKCIETPNEPSPEFPKRVPLKAYPTREAGGALWVYFGAGNAPRFPDLIFNHLDDERLCTRAALCDYNWLTGLDAILDPTHVGLLHRNWVEQAPNQGFSKDINMMGQKLSARIEVEQTDYGMRYAAIRDMPDGGTYIRVTEHIEPSGCFIANSRDTRKLFIMSVPIDNLRSIQWYFWHSPTATMPEEDRQYAIGATDLDDDNFYQTPKKQHLWGQDREAMIQGKSFTGFTDIMFEDFIAGEAQGAWPDRTKENLGTADLAIVKARQFLIRKLQRLQGGEEGVFRHPENVRYYALQALATQVAENVDWRDAAARATDERAKQFAPA
jgi:phenylpropionate dioxygenase-like ring-hydroxylating dioxygenase large terminal subunit